MSRDPLYDATPAEIRQLVRRAFLKASAGADPVAVVMAALCPVLDAKDGALRRERESFAELRAALHAMAAELEEHHRREEASLRRLAG